MCEYVHTHVYTCTHLHVYLCVLQFIPCNRVSQWTTERTSEEEPGDMSPADESTLTS